MSNRGKRGVATFSKKDCDWTIEFDKDMQPIGKNANNFITWLGIKLKKEFPYHIASTKFEKEKWENLWLDIKEQWHIEGEASKNVMIKKAKKQHTNWRSLLTTDYVRNEITPFEKYKYLDSNQWEAFVAERTSKAFLIKSNKAKESASKNLIPTRLGRLGFAQLNPKLELIWSQLVEIYTFLEDIQDERSKRWIVSRAKKNKENNTYELVEEAHADSIKLAKFEKEMIKDGSYCSGKEDPLTRLLGPEHGGRSRTTSHIIGRTQVQGGLFQNGKRHLPSSQPRSCMGLGLNPDSRGASDASGGSHIDYPHIEEPTFCKLLFPYLSKKERIIGTGHLHPTTSRILHGKQMEEGYVKVQIDDILPEHKTVPLPIVSCIDDIEEIGEAIGYFIQWPLFAVKFSNTQATHQNEPLRQPAQADGCYEAEFVLPALFKKRKSNRYKVSKEVLKPCTFMHR